MRYRVNHVTTYAYAQAVDLGSHMLHLSPRALSGLLPDVRARLVAVELTHEQFYTTRYGSPLAAVRAIEGDVSTSTSRIGATSASCKRTRNWSVRA